MAAHQQPWACFLRFGFEFVHRVCIVLHFALPSNFHGSSCPNLPVLTKSLMFMDLSFPVIWTTGTSNFGAANASTQGNKEAANSSNMTFTLFDSPRHFPNRSGWRNGHCLS
jgi:hypothetical protein